MGRYSLHLDNVHTYINEWLLHIALVTVQKTGSYLFIYTQL